MTRRKASSGVSNVLGGRKKRMILCLRKLAYMMEQNAECV